MKTLAAALALTLAFPASAALAQSGHHGGGHYSGGHYGGGRYSSGHYGGGHYGHGYYGHGYYGGWYGGYYFNPFWPLYYPYSSYPPSYDDGDSDYPHVYGPPPSEQPAPGTGHNWFFCKESNGYYPYVKSCPNGWQQVSPEPPDASGGEAPEAPPPQR